MAFVVEDGTGLSGANSYASVTEALTYFNDVQNTTWTSASTSAQQAALVQASRYIDLRWGIKFPGQQLSPDQGLEFPRTGTHGLDNSIPQLLKRAVYEYGVRALQNPLAPDPQTNSGPITYQKSKKVGPLEFTYGVVSSGLGSTVEPFLTYPVPDALMKRLIGATGTGRAYR